MVVYIEDEHLAAVQTPSFMGAIRLWNPLTSRICRQRVGWVDAQLLTSIVFQGNLDPWEV